MVAQDVLLGCCTMQDLKECVLVEVTCLSEVLEQICDTVCCCNPEDYYLNIY